MFNECASVKEHQEAEQSMKYSWTAIKSSGKEYPAYFEHTCKKKKNTQIYEETGQ